MLTGSGWQAGESVNVVVNDDAGQTWNRNVNVTADQSGNISDSFNLPVWFVATYSVNATLASGAIATTSFTDGTVRVKAAGTGGASAPISWELYNTTNCTGTVAGSGSFNAGTSGSGTAVQGSGNVDVTGSQSLKLTAGAFSGFTFSSWQDGNFTTGSFTTTSNPGCLQGANGTQNTQVNYAVNQAPVLGAIGNKSVNEGSQLSFTASATDANGNNTITYYSPTAPAALPARVHRALWCHHQQFHRRLQLDTERGSGPRHLQAEGQGDRQRFA